MGGIRQGVNEITIRPAARLPNLGTALPSATGSGMALITSIKGLSAWQFHQAFDAGQKRADLIQQAEGHCAISRPPLDRSENDSRFRRRATAP